MKRIFCILVVLVLNSSLFILHSQAQKKQKNEHSFSVAKNMDVFNSLYRDLDVMYVDTLDADELVKVGIDAMLSSLDPYTEYFPEEDMGELKMMTTGKYGGMGSIIRMRKDSLVVIGEPYANMPAAEVGLKVGDVLKMIDDTDLKGMKVDEVSNMLRGEPGTTFVLTVQRPGEKKERKFSITRRNIKLPSIPWSGMVSDKVGYINLSQFTEDCSVDLRKAFISLKDKGAESFIIDLRGNGGGLLSEAVNIVNLFVRKGLTIVETKGKIKAANTTYKTKSEPLDTLTRIAVLVNGTTASASEIVSGSLQDLDRAVVIGARTYGKGLVQSSRELPYNGSLKLTTSKYYIPRGRCIQAIDYKLKRDGKTSKVPDSLTNVFHTIGGREVRDGGGIKPDIEIKHDTMANVVFYLSNDDVLLDWGTKYAQKHAEIAPIEEFEITDADFEELKEMARKSGFKYDRLSENRLKDLRKVAEFEGYYEDAKEEFEALEKKLEHNLDREFDRFKKDIKELMAQEIVKRYYYQSGALQEALKADEDLAKAIEVLGSEEYDRILMKNEE
ncbi:MAG: PDZ domain-containing protein [Bacteroidaceae bacterium]|nr:PDZ domain-containing protein [Bacteroidaceae bacterium]